MKLFRSLIVALVIMAVFTPIMTKEAPKLQHSEFGTFASGHAVNWENVKNWVYPWRWSWFHDNPSANPPAAQNNASSKPAGESKPAAAAPAQKSAAAEPAKAK